MKRNTKSQKLAKLLSLGLLLFSLNLMGQTKAEQIDALMQKYFEYNKFHGSVLVADQGEVLYKNGFGYANIEWQIPNAANTKHRLGSITKQFTAMLILQLAEEGKLDLQAPIATYLPDYPKPYADQITIHMLLTHTSGIPNYTSIEGLVRKESRNYYSPEDFIAFFSELDLDFEPGSQHNYSNSGYFLLGLIVEKLSMMSYEDALQQRIFDPLKMMDTGYDTARKIISNRAAGYERNGRNLINAPFLDMSLPYAAGAMYSTVEDLFLWDRALYTNKLLSKEYMDKYLSPYTKEVGDFRYGYGLVHGNIPLGTSKDSLFMMGHDGGINGFNTRISRAPSEESMVVLLNNTGAAPLKEITLKIMAILKDAEFNAPKQSMANAMVAVASEKGIDAAFDFYKKNKDNAGYELLENEVNAVGYELLFNKQMKEAARVFELNMEAFPNSFNVYDSYAEVMMYMGKRKQAIKYYQKSLELNPANQNGIDMLKRMGVEVNTEEEVMVIAEDILLTYTGTYEMTAGFVVNVTLENGQMYAEATGQGKFAIYPRSESAFYTKDINAQMQFNKNAAGKVDSILLSFNGQEIPGKKIK